jgi:hypothetical protein
LKRTKVIQKLINLGFRKNCVMETILVTMNPDGSFNPAPMGVTWIGNEIIEIRPFKSSQTYKNLLNTKNSHINIINNPMIFLKSAFKREFDNTFQMDDFILNGCEALISLEKIKGSEISEDRYNFKNQVIDVKIYHKYPRVFSRGTSEAIEAVIHATRVQFNREKGIIEEVKQLEDKINDCSKLIRRISDRDSLERRVAQKIEDLLKKWREK